MKSKLISTQYMPFFLFYLVICVNFFSFNPYIVRGTLLLYVFHESISNSKRTYLNKLSLSYGLFIAYYCLSILWGSGILAVGYVFSCLVSVFLLILFLTARLKTTIHIKKIMFFFIILNIFSLLCLIIVTPINEWGTERIGDKIGANANSLGMNAAYSAIYIFYLNKKRKNNQLLLFLIPMLLLVLLSGSRKAFFIIIVGIGLFAYLTSDQKNKIPTIIIVLLAVFVLYYITMHNEMLYNIIGKRIEAMDANAGIRDGSLNKRAFFREYALDMFKQKKLFGWGAEGFRMEMQRINYPLVAYSHCNYTELLANFGLIGFLIYYVPISGLIIKYIKHIKSRKDDLHVVFLVYMIMLFIVDYGVVSYYSIESWSRIICAFAYINIELSTKEE